MEDVLEGTVLTIPLTMGQLYGDIVAYLLLRCCEKSRVDGVVRRP